MSRIPLPVPACASGLLEECRAPQVMGAHYDGAWAEFALVPWYALAALPDQVSLEHGAIACDAVSTPYAALLERGALRPGERVGLWGIGGLGTHAVQIARLAGAAFIAAVDPISEARERALRLGADAAFDPADDVPNLVRDATDGRGLDLVRDATDGRGLDLGPSPLGPRERGDRPPALEGWLAGPAAGHATGGARPRGRPGSGRRSSCRYVTREGWAERGHPFDERGNGP